MLGGSDPIGGPYILDTVGKSQNTNIAAGIWTFNTATGGPEAVVAGPAQQGLHALVQHQVNFLSVPIMIHRNQGAAIDGNAGRPPPGGLPVGAGDSVRPGNLAYVATLTKPVLLAAAALVAFIALYPAAREHFPSIHELGSRSPSTESASQLSPGEFDAVGPGFTPTHLRSFAGDPADKTDASVEGVDLECWYYGIAGARGAFQVCFENGRFSTKTRFDRSHLSS